MQRKEVATIVFIIYGSKEIRFD